MYPSSYHSINVFSKELRVSLFDDKTVTIAANPSIGDNTTMIINIGGEQSQLRYIAKRILELIPEELTVQSTADDEAAKTMEQLQVARENEPIDLKKAG